MSPTQVMQNPASETITQIKNPSISQSTQNKKFPTAACLPYPLAAFSPQTIPVAKKQARPSRPTRLAWRSVRSSEFRYRPERSSSEQNIKHHKKAKTAPKITGFMGHTHELRLKPGGQNHHDQKSAAAEGPSRKNSRSRGINFQTVLARAPSTNQAQKTTPIPSTKPKSDDVSFCVSENGPLDRKYPAAKCPLAAYLSRFDVALPTSADLEKCDFNDKLRLLALKEMAVVELKDILAETQAKLNESERDLLSLRTVIQRSLYRQMSNEATRKSAAKSAQTETVKSHSDLCKSSLKAAKIVRFNLAEGEGNRTTNLHPVKRHLHVQEKKTLEPNSAPNAVADSEVVARDSESGDRLLKLWENLSKPISFIQNIDLMLQHEFEKSLVGGDFVSKSDEALISQKSVHVSEAASSSAKSEAHYKNTHKLQSLLEQQDENLPYDQSQFRQLMDNKLGGIGAYNRKDADDMFQAVSNSLWGFVNEVKTNMASLLGDFPEEAENPVKHLAGSGFTPKLINLSDKIHENSPPIKEESDLESVDLLQFSDDDEQPVDLSMYSTMRRKKA